MGKRVKENYRKIWEHHNGEIPLDENGVSYHIHHIDGNSKNNNISNLQCVSVEQHYKIHLNQGDYAAANALKHFWLHSKLNGWNHSSETKRKISESLKGHRHSKKTRELLSKKQIEDYASGKRVHWALGVKRPDVVERNKKGPTDEIRKKMSEAKLNQPELICPHCGKIGKGNQMYRWHFDNCKTLKT
jgi:hypothetical protein